VCTYQLWCFLILWCSTWLEDSKDYKFVIFGWVEQKIWISQGNRWVWINLKMSSNLITDTMKYMALVDSTLPKLSIDILFVQIRVVGLFLWIKQDAANLKPI
jgi:hypothetical protein